MRHVSWDCEDSYDMPAAVWQKLIAQHFPNTGWLRLDHDTIAALSRYRVSDGLLDLDDAISALVAQRASRRAPTAPEAAMTVGSDHARAVADAVLYEGYLLYPYRASSRKNQCRWQFGVLGPPGAAEAGLVRKARWTPVR